MQRAALFAMMLLVIAVGTWNRGVVAQTVPISGLPTLSPFPNASDVLPMVHYTMGAGTTSKVTVPQLIPVFNILWYGADPSGTNDSTPALQAAVNLAATSGGEVLMPQGTYKLGGPIMLPGGSYSIVGYGANTSVLQPQRSDYDVFYACAAAAPSPNPTFLTATPIPLPSPTNFTACGPPASGNKVIGLTLQDFGIAHPSAVTLPVYDINLPTAQLVDIVRLQTSSSFNVISLGETSTSAWTNVTIQGNSFLNFGNDLITLHGGGGQLWILNNYVSGTQGSIPSTTQFQSTILDASDEFTTTAQFVTNNDFENVANGFIYLVPSSHAISDSFFDSNLFNGTNDFAYYIRALPNTPSGTPPPISQRIKIRNSSLLSQWDGVYLDGGLYPASGSNGIVDVSVHNSVLIGGQTPGTSSQVVLFSGAPAATSDSITFTYKNGAFNHFVTATPSSCTPNCPTMSTLTATLAAAINADANLKTKLVAGSVSMGNGFFGLLLVATKSTPPPNSLTNGTLYVQTAGSGTYPISTVSPTPGPAATYSAPLAAGDGMYLVNTPRSIDVIGNQFYSTQGAAIHVNSVGHTNIFNNTISGITGANNLYGIYFDSAVTPAPSDVFVQGNDMTLNTTSIGGSAPTPNATPNTAIFRNNRGYNPFGAITAPTFPNGSTQYISSIYDCEVYVATNGATLSMMLIGTNGSAFSIPISSGFARFSFPAGANFTATYSGGTPTWTWFCN